MVGELEAVPIGLSESLRERVAWDMTATQVGSGDVAVLATPVVVALVEQAAVHALGGKLPPGSTSVGTMVRLAHVAPTPVGAKLEVQVRVSAVDSNRLTFSFRVLDEAGEVATGTHDRVVVDRQRFERDAARRTG